MQRCARLQPRQPSPVEHFYISILFFSDEKWWKIFFTEIDWLILQIGFIQTTMFHQGKSTNFEHFRFQFDSDWNKNEKCS